MTSKAKIVPANLSDAGLTLSSQLREFIRSQIHAGDLKTGDQLPSENELGKMHGVSRITVRQALAAYSSDRDHSI